MPPLDRAIATCKSPRMESFWDGRFRGRKSLIRERFLKAKVRGFWDTIRLLAVL